MPRSKSPRGRVIPAAGREPDLRVRLGEEEAFFASYDPWAEHHGPAGWDRPSDRRPIPTLVDLSYEDWSEAGYHVALW